MPMMPKRVRYRKSQRGKMKGNATRGNTVAFGEYGLQSLSRPGSRPGRSRPAVSPAATTCDARVASSSAFFPTSLSPASRWKPAWVKARVSRNTGVAIVKPGTVMFEITGVDEPTAKKALARVAHKMPVQDAFRAAHATRSLEETLEPKH